MSDIRIDPLVLDLDGDGIHLTNRATSTALFDIDADGFREQTGWISHNDAFVFDDRNGNNIVDDVREMIGGPGVNGTVRPFFQPRIVNINLLPT